MRALQLLRDADLIWIHPNSMRLQKSGVRSQKPVYAEPVDERIYPVSARILLERGLIEMKRFNPREAIYALTKEGRQLTELLCECASKEQRAKSKGRKMGTRLGRDRAENYTLLTGVDPLTTSPKIDWPKERLLCKKCWRLARCEAKFFKQPHHANRYIWGIGPVCQFHVDNPNRR